MLIGGGGIDTASYFTSGLAVKVDLTTNINTGGDARGDSLSGIENVRGSGFADTLVGNAAVNRIDAGEGDILTGRGGGDVLIGGGGIDTSSYFTSALG